MPQDRSAPTLDDVATAAGVSTATVSRCLNDPDKVIEKTRARVLAAVDALGYTPNFAARVMTAGRSRTIGAVIPTMDNAIFATGLQAFQEELRARGYTLLVASTAYKPEVELEQIRTLVSRGADGILLIGQDRDAGVLDYLARRKVPALTTWSWAEEAAIPAIGFHNRSAMAELTRVVLGRGYRRIAMIAGISKGNDRAFWRIEGVRDALEEVGIDPYSLRLLEVAYTIDAGAAALQALVSPTSDTRPEVVICGNDVLAVGAMKGAHKLGLRVPEDLSITGFDDLELARIVSPELTTVRVPHREMGRAAARELVEMVEQGRPGQSQRLGTELVLRGSLGAGP